MEQSVTIQGASNLDESEVNTMLEDAEKFATADQEKRKNIDLKNNAEALCYEANKQLLSVKDTVSPEKEESITKLIEDIKSNLDSENFDAVTNQLEQLKAEMQELLQAAAPNNEA